MKSLAVFLFLFVALNGFSQSKIEADDTTNRYFAKVETGATFPGGDSAWIKFISSHMRYPKAAKKKKIEGTVVVHFIVSKTGDIADIEAVSGPEELRYEAERVIKISPKWIPETQGGYAVKSYKRQSIAFRLPVN